MSGCAEKGQRGCSGFYSLIQVGLDCTELAEQVALRIQNQWWRVSLGRQEVNVVPLPMLLLVQKKC